MKWALIALGVALLLIYFLRKGEAAGGFAESKITDWKLARDRGGYASPAPEAVAYGVPKGVLDSVSASDIWNNADAFINPTTGGTLANDFAETGVTHPLVAVDDSYMGEWASVNPGFLLWLESNGHAGLAAAPNVGTGGFLRAVYQ